ncbi:hypothetical protein PMIT1313_00867 [Prochlorococcus marinus str. MIT 1313]|uniref:hypothetical protein n=1 Tax=Prochlorococcus TaxID=1218 RepID=UPI0007C127DD|nr:hypothetical protein [Prochlorococcus marinus]KZR69762.1 hypothetical protein PMIT1313_00867 [Prochlorococcus marinus str. MIT 1313]
MARRKTALCDHLNTTLLNQNGQDCECSWLIPKGSFDLVLDSTPAIEAPGVNDISLKTVKVLEAC